MAKAGSSTPPGRPPSSAGLPSPSDRDRILQAMTECCAEYGYGETTVEEVVARAGVRREAFDAAFADKEDCALAALNWITSELLASVSALVLGPGAGPGSEFEGGIAGLAAILELMASRPSYAGIAYIQARQGGTARMHGTYESGVRVLTAMMDRARGFVPETPASPASATRAALGGAEAVVRREIAAGRIERLPALLPAFVYGALVPLVGQEEALRQSRQAAKLIAGAG
jgi:AcrR family transcriptional regulator